MEIKIIRKKIKNIRAFTLIELTVSMGVLALIVGLTAGVLISVVKSYQRERVISEVERNGDFIIRSIEESMRGAQNISCLKFDKTPAPANADGTVTCSLGAASGRLLFIESNTGSKYFGMGSDSGATFKATCPPGTPTNCYVFALDNPTQVAADGTLSNDYNKLTNSSAVNGVNLTKFNVIVSAGAPYNIAATIDVRGPVGSAWELQTARTFQSFLTLRGSYQ